MILLVGPNVMHFTPRALQRFLPLHNKPVATWASHFRVAPKSCGKLVSPTTTAGGDVMIETPLDSVQAQALKLSAADRTKLLDVLLDSMDHDEATEREWELLADERDAELDSGKVSARDGPAVLASLRAKHLT
jgi:Putative addiction module component